MKQKKRGEEIAEKTYDLVPIYNRGPLPHVIQGMDAAISSKLVFFLFRIGCVGRSSIQNDDNLMTRKWAVVCSEFKRIVGQ
jgi:hypothetical protein